MQARLAGALVAVNLKVWAYLCRNGQVAVKNRNMGRADASRIDLLAAGT